MISLTEKLKYADDIKKKDVSSAIDYTKKIIEQNDLLENEYLKIGKKILSLVRNQNIDFVNENIDFVIKFIKTKIAEKNQVCELNLSISRLLDDSMQREKCINYCFVSLAEIDLIEWKSKLFASELHSIIAKQYAVGVFNNTSALECINHTIMAFINEFIFNLQIHSLLKSKKSAFDKLIIEYQNNVFLNDDNELFKIAMESMNPKLSKNDIYSLIINYLLENIDFEDHKTNKIIFVPDNNNTKKFIEEFLINTR